MPVQFATMIKHADLFGEGQRSPTDYYEQLQRCSGMVPLNIFATINNRWIAGEPAHDSWENEFFSDRTSNGVRRFRSRIEDNAIVFTRPSALLNLKALLGIQPQISQFKRTAIGATILHANDYLETVEPSRLSRGTLPVIAEFAPAWELHNPRDTKQLLARSLYLYQLLQSDLRMQALFNQPIASVKFAGLSFHEYVALLFGIYTNARSSIRETPYPTSILDVQYISDEAHLTVQQLKAFANGKALTLAEAREVIDISDRNTFVSCITDNAWTSNQLTFRNRPLLQFPDGRFLVLDLQFLLESASAGISWELMRHLTTGKRKLFLDYWGAIFERYVQDLLAHYYPDQAPIGKRYERDGQIDGLIAVGDDRILLEVKAGFLRDDAKGSRDPAILEKALRKKYVTNERGQRVGIRQLATTANALLNGDVPNITTNGRIYPVLVGEDPILQVPGVNIFLSEIFREESTSDRVGPLTVMLVDELEQLLPHITSGDLSWQDVVSRRVSHGQMSPEPVHTTLVDLAIDRRFRRRSETFLSTHASALVDMIKQTYKGLQ
jgi:hypothetical protein